MPIVFKCACGKDFKVNDELAGRKFRCSKCQTVGVVPMPTAPKPALVDSGQVPPDDKPPAKRFTSRTAAATLKAKSPPAEQSKPEPMMAKRAKQSVLDASNDYYPAAAPIPPPPGSNPFAPGASNWQQNQAKPPVNAAPLEPPPIQPSNLYQNLMIVFGLITIVFAILAGAASKDGEGMRRSAISGAVGVGSLLAGLLRRNWD